MKTQTITIHKQTFVLHPSGALYWEQKAMLLIADVHLGKVTHFRKHGSAVPQSAIIQNFVQLDTVTQYFQPKTICFLGDLFHSHLNTEWLLFESWVKEQKATIVLIVGNHDIIEPLRYKKLGIHITDQWQLDSIFLTHHPEIKSQLYNIAGHIHPGVQLRGLGKQFLKVSCFLKREKQMIVPAFGTFTGNYIIQPEAQDQIFVITQDEVIKIYTS